MKIGEMNISPKSISFLEELLVLAEKHKLPLWDLQNDLLFLLKGIDKTANLFRGKDKDSVIIPRELKEKLIAPWARQMMKDDEETPCSTVT